MLGGIVVLAAGVKQSVADYDTSAAPSTAWFLAAGVATYIGGLALFRWVLHTGSLWPRLCMAGAALATVAVGTEVSPEVQIATLIVVVCAGILCETRVARAAVR